jgi:hypothetical protein
MASSWSIIINQRDRQITFTPDVPGAGTGQPLGVNAGDNVTWNNRTNQEITLKSIQPEGVFLCDPIPAGDVSSPIFNVKAVGTVGYSWVRRDAPTPTQPDAWIVVIGSGESIDPIDPWPRRWNVADQQTERVYQVYDMAKTLLLNKKYYAERLSRYRKYNLAMEILIAGGAAASAGSGVAGFAVWQSATGKITWGLISAAAVILTSAKPLLKLTDRIEMYATLYGDYTSAHGRVQILVDDMQVQRALPPARIRLFEEMRIRATELSKLGDATPNPDVVKRIQDEVNKEIPIDELWLPGDQ